MAEANTFPRTLKREPGHEHRLAQTMPYRLVRRIALGAAPAFYSCLLEVLSFWLNQIDGDCVTAEQCFNIALASFIASGTEFIISDDDTRRFASRYGLLNGADLSQVNTIMATDGMPTSDGKLFKVGPEAAVDWTNYEETCAAMFEAQGSLQMAIQADQLERAANDNQKFNYALNFHRQSNADHCTGLGGGYGTLQECNDALNAFYAKLAAKLGTSFTPQPLPANIDPATPCFIMFSWRRFWIITHGSVIAITEEMKIRRPSSTVAPPWPAPVAPPAPVPEPQAELFPIVAELQEYLTKHPGEVDIRADQIHAILGV